MATRVYSLVVNSSAAGQFCSNVLHYQFDDSGYATTQAAANALIDAWDTNSRTALRTILPADTSLLSLRSRLVNGVGGFEAVKILTAPVVGLRAGAQSASGLSPVLIQYAANNDKRRGRWFLPGVSEADCVDGIFTAAYKVAVAAQITTLFQNITLAGGGAPTAEKVIYDRVHRDGTLIEWIELSDVLGTVRRRQLPA
jgi:hypothetical protein